MKRGLDASAKSINPRQPAQSAQADMVDTFCYWSYAEDNVSDSVIHSLD